MGPDYYGYKITVESPRRLNWATAKQKVEELKLTPEIRAMLEDWQEQLEANEADSQQHFLDLYQEAADGDLSSLQQVLTLDLERLAGWLTNQPASDFEEGYDARVQVIRLNGGVIIATTIDLRYYVAPLDGYYETLERLSEFGLLDPIGGLAWEVTF